ncbi:MAG: GumC family protein, partial [Pseudomonadota bacterium]
MLGQEQFEKVSGIDYLHIISIFKRRYRTIILCSLLSVIAAVTYVIQATPQYRAETALLIDTRQQNVLAGAAVLAGLTTESGIIESQVEIIRSRSLLNRVAEKIDLYSDEEFLPHEGGAISNLISQFLPSSEDEEETIDPIQAEAIKKSIVLNQMDDRLMVLRKGTTQVLIIGFRSRDPEKARVIVDAVATAYLNDQLEAKLDATKRASAWLEERISGLRDELRVREQAIAAFKQKYSLYSADGATPIEQQVARLNEQLIIAKSNTAEKRAAYNQVRRLSGRGALESFSGVLSSNVIASLRDRKSEIARELADLSERYGDQHPKLRKVKSQMQDINRQISSEVKRILANAKSEFEIAKSRENSLASSLKSLRSQLNITGKYSTQLAQLEREAEIARTAFEAISERFKQTDKSEDVQQSDARIISKAETPIFPVSPKKKIIVLLALIGGSIIGCIIAFIREYLIRGFMTSDMVEEVLGISVISNIQEVDEKI